MWKNILIIGGNGNLGTHMKPYLDGMRPTEQEFDIVKRHEAIPSRFLECDLILHMAAYTAVDKAETEKKKCFNINVVGTFNLLKMFPDKPFVFISTEHAEAKGIYFQSKLMGELLVKNLASNYLIIRTLFKNRPWQWEYAFTDQMTQGDYVDVVAPLIAFQVQKWNGKESKSIFVGTGRKSMFDLAKRTKPDVKPNSVKDLPLERPTDYL